MRIIGGTAKGRKLKAVPGSTTRPILDRVRTSLFDILRPNLTDTIWLDLFAGTGSVGIEALSQGAKHCTFTDLADLAVQTINENLENTELKSKATVKKMDAFRFIKHCNESYDYIYIAPPQYQNIWEQAIYAVAERPEMLKSNGSIIIQIDPKEYSPLALTNFQETEQRKYGNTLLVFYKRAI
jgi:16S rRNA (guanine(966)-N(2))-methyltransferase RsmD